MKGERKNKGVKKGISLNRNGIEKMEEIKQEEAPDEIKHVLKKRKREVSVKSESTGIKTEPEDVSELEEQFDQYHLNHLYIDRNDIKNDLLQWYYKYRRRLPWRNDKPPYTFSIQLEQLEKDVYNRKPSIQGETNIINGRKKEESSILNYFSKKKKITEGSTSKETDEVEMNDDSKNIKTNDSINNVPLIEENEFCDVSNKAYYIYISEIMLQQTRVHTVINYYLKWISRWRTIHDFAKSSIDDVLTEWKGLGYYNRARNLLKCAQIIVEKYNGVFPNNLKELQKLPGIGDYTSKAILIHTYNYRDICIDTNIVRIFSRITDVVNYNHSSSLTKHCQKVAKIICEEEDRCSDISQALMDLGSSLCNNTPKCNLCPLSKYCLIYKRTHKKQLQPKGKRKIKKDRTILYEHPKNCQLCIEERDSVDMKNVPLIKIKKKKDKKCIVLLVSRKKKETKVEEEEESFLMQRNIYTNLFSMHYLFPHILLDEFQKEKCESHLISLLDSFNLQIQEGTSFSFIHNFKHKFSHITYDTYVYFCSVVYMESTVAQDENCLWVLKRDMEKHSHNSFCQTIFDNFQKYQKGRKSYFLSY